MTASAPYPPTRLPNRVPSFVSLISVIPRTIPQDFSAVNSSKPRQRAPCGWSQLSIRRKPRGACVGRPEEFTAEGLPISA
ncbi:hypothetical protein ACFFQF_07070 [Haladaptatus pallidirubidus]|uniref:hypothetical protein n=1 Tax=Haladaptatus pallidirubidus TaxID=1008152 RepID=UPI001D110D7C|nr:hypothetical protein [Haladaptatus pallidirubidus]